MNFSCLAALAGGESLAGLLWAEARDRRSARAAPKVATSLGFVGLAPSSGARDSYGRLVLGGLVLSLAGDAILLSRERRAFLLGLLAFLGAHLAYAAAFALASRPRGLALLPLAAVSGVALRWLWPHLGSLRLPVSIYTTAITAMLWPALGSSRLEVGCGALLFYLSDLLVARGAFGAPGKVNQLAGWPLYYAGQYLIAASVG